MTAEMDAYAPNSALTELAGDAPRLRILITLLGEPTGRALNKTEIATQAGLSRTTVHNHIDALATLGDEGEGIEPPVMRVPSPDGHPVYRLNTDSDVAKRLAQLEWDVIDLIAAERETS